MSVTLSHFRAIAESATIINPESMNHMGSIMEITLSFIGSTFVVFCDGLEDGLEILGAWCDDNAPGYITDTSQMSEEERDQGSYYFVNGALDCALDLSECTQDMCAVTANPFRK